MEKFTALRGIAAPLLIPNIDTGALCPTDWLRDNPNNLGPGMLMAWRYDATGADNPDFVLNRPRYRGARILIAGENFGCGSSREGAVQALLAEGFRCVIAPSFGDIFRDNCYQLGLLPIRFDGATVAALAATIEAAPEPILDVDLAAQMVTALGQAPLSFEIAADRRLALLEGLDETLVIRCLEADIAAFQARDAEQRPWIYARDLPG